MVEFTRILCPIDFSEFSMRSLAHGAALAKWYEAQLTVLHVLPVFDPMQVGALGEALPAITPMPRERVLEQMRQAVQSVTDSPNVNLVVESGNAPTVIVDQAMSSHADLIIMGTHGFRGFRRLLMGSVTERVLREAPCPVLTVPRHAQTTASEPLTFKRVLCPIDFSSAAVQALGFALDLARQADGLVTLMHVVEGPSEAETRASARLGHPELRGHVAADLEERLRLLVAAESRAWVEIEHVVAYGRAHREILRVAETKPVDLIVMGAQGKSGIGLAFFGSTTQQVLRGAICPVLTVRGGQGSAADTSTLVHVRQDDSPRTAPHSERSWSTTLEALHGTTRRLPPITGSISMDARLKTSLAAET